MVPALTHPRYLVMDYCSGGELFFHLKHSGIFGISRSKL